MWRSLPTAAADQAPSRCSLHTQFSLSAARLVCSSRCQTAARGARRALSIRVDVSGGVVDTDPTTVPGINVIPESRWKKGIPPVMGAHLMDSGAVRVLQDDLCMAACCLAQLKATRNPGA